MQTIASDRKLSSDKEEYCRLCKPRLAVAIHRALWSHRQTRLEGLSMSNASPAPQPQPHPRPRLDPFSYTAAACKTVIGQLPSIRGLLRATSGKRALRKHAPTASAAAKMPGARTPRKGSCFEAAHETSCATYRRRKASSMNMQWCVKWLVHNSQSHDLAPDNPLDPSE
jgi:hypothetical protein